ncbi:Hypothetical predicted protein [Octopus vulgaris]|uniref:Uncharacterized protein n=1 Tax=Octopus vulgaris TaxID=6645 RepID=A0AA36BWP6_OCTVU|nr:Hypothetical predicted protein [Octopus vulgaris]
MADPKYANLPGIDLNSPDVYETSELPEDDQNTRPEQEEIHSDAIERVNLDSKTAYKRFKGTVLDASNADFSGRIQKQRNTGYDIIKNEYEMVWNSLTYFEGTSNYSQKVVDLPVITVVYQ